MSARGAAPPAPTPHRQRVTERNHGPHPSITPLKTRNQHEYAVSPPDTDIHHTHRSLRVTTKRSHIVTLERAISIRLSFRVRYEVTGIRNVADLGYCHLAPCRGERRKPRD
ncbi:hypothetical protein Acsp01_89110 [Actinoplanes sp. NBRC 101535]|nr:hypothetical protein Acsp01_89110 [Actinoplanes sp. NBRC 101535]